MPCPCEQESAGFRLDFFLRRNDKELEINFSEVSVLYSNSRHSLTINNIKELNLEESSYELSNFQMNSPSELFICLLLKYVLLNFICTSDFFEIYLFRGAKRNYLTNNIFLVWLNLPEVILYR